ncbi:hypothetical protein ABQF44_09935 [Mycolicibacterium porcinum]|uniref:Secreted protein n=1 Tax=Mycolicibacterium porcinum TaxID=39693 RepID=A0AAW5TAA0_9MYCO|nr:hypothetical protein [Mycolicibacterium porcinum]MCV7391787.1 hypothetical protein [Mycolicibacterium porcinum]ODR27057.1 hypothetical protein BHQ19_03465 [Mycolicibacterium porcinum]ORB38587.1 hypothetical protein BST41_19565 [Mycolicibacterium porcinum]CDO33463.1 hypothetical protein BN979_06313 [Mycolicibacterium vulneris]
MNRWKNLGIISAGLGVVAVPIGIAVAGAGTASADPGLCVNGPFGYAQACVDVPGWYNGWYDGPRWHGGDWHHGGDWGEDD